MLLSPLRPRGKLRPAWELDTELREHSLAAGWGPGLWLVAHPGGLTIGLLANSGLPASLVAVFKDIWPNCQNWA